MLKISSFFSYTRINTSDPPSEYWHVRFTKNILKIFVCPELMKRPGFSVGKLDGIISILWFLMLKVCHLLFFFKSWNRRDGKKLLLNCQNILAYHSIQSLHALPQNLPAFCQLRHLNSRERKVQTDARFKPDTWVSRVSGLGTIFWIFIINVLVKLFLHAARANIN